MCRKTHEEAEKDPPCERCHPGIHPFNEPIVTIYQAAQGQYISNSNGIIGLNLLAADKAMDWHKVANSERDEFWECLCIIVDSLISSCTKEAEEKARLAKLQG